MQYKATIFHTARAKHKKPCEHNANANANANATQTIITNSLLARGENFRSLTMVEAAHREYRGMSLDIEREQVRSEVFMCPLVR